MALYDLGDVYGHSFTAQVGVPQYGGTVTPKTITGCKISSFELAAASGEIATPSTSATTGALTVVGGVGIQGDLNIDGDVDIQGTITFGGAGTTVETANLSVTDPIVFVGNDNAADTSDLGIVGEYTSSGTKYAGIVRDASDGVFKAFKDATTKPTSSVNFSEGGLAYADVRVGGLTASSLTVGDVSSTEIGYLDGVSSSIQTQLNAKAPLANPTFTGTVTVPATITAPDSAVITLPTSTSTLATTGMANQGGSGGPGIFFNGSYYAGGGGQGGGNGLVGQAATSFGSGGGAGGNDTYPQSGAGFKGLVIIRYTLN